MPCRGCCYCVGFGAHRVSRSSRGGNRNGRGGNRSSRGGDHGSRGSRGGNRYGRGGNRSSRGGNRSSRGGDRGSRGGTLSGIDLLIDADRRIEEIEKFNNREFIYFIIYFIL